MDPNGAQCSINCPYDGNAVGFPGPALPRSFTLVGHGRMDCGAFPVFSIVLSPGKSFTCPSHERQTYIVSLSLSRNHSRDPVLDLFGLAIVRGNSHALFLAIVLGNQTRILFVLFSAGRLFLGFIAAHPSALNLNVPYTVTTGT